MDIENKLNINRINEAINILKVQIDLINKLNKENKTVENNLSWASLMSVQSVLEKTLNGMCRNVLIKEKPMTQSYIEIEDNYLLREDSDLELCFGQWLIKYNYIDIYR